MNSDTEYGLIRFLKRLNNLRWRLYLTFKNKLYRILFKSSRKFIEDFIVYVPNTGGSVLGLENEIANLTRMAILQTPVFLGELQFKIEKSEIIIKTAEDFANSFIDGNNTAEKFKKVFDKYNSDKTLNHNYHLIYGPIIQSIDSVNTVFEIGLGTVNADVVSNMGKNWLPGASLRAFRELLPNTLYLWR